MESLFYTIILVLSLIIIFFIITLLTKKKYDSKLVEYEAKARQLDENAGKIVKLESDIRELYPYKLLSEERRAELQALKIDLERIQKELTDSTAENRSLETLLDQQKITLDTSYRKMEAEFQNLAQKMLEESTKKLGEKSTESLKSVLDPLVRDLGEFKKRVDSTHEEDTKQRAGLQTQVRLLMELNQKISKEAENLTKALKGESKTQGSWGEMILERVLESSGLRKGEEYETQVSFTVDEGKRLQPDVIVHLPEKRDVIIDSKVSLVDYDAFMSADTEDERKESASSLAQSIRRHLSGLSSKAYQKIEGIDSIDIVVMFIAIEGALSVASMSDRMLVEDALRQNVMLASPTSLLAVLKGIEYGWRSERQSRNVQNIFKLAGDLYDKFALYAQDMEELGSKLDQAGRSYASAKNKLISGKGNITVRVEKMRELGAKNSKAIPQSWENSDTTLIEDQS